MGVWKVAALAGLAMLAGMAGAQDRADARLDGDRYSAGDEVRVDEDVAGDAFVAAGRSHLSARVGGDAVVTGGEVNIRGSVGDDLYVAGGDVHIEADVDGNVRAAGGVVTVARSAALQGTVTLAGGRVEVDGRIARSLVVFGERIVINGEVGGDVRATGERIRIGPDARIAGKLRYRSRHEADIDPRARIEGGIERRGHFRSDWAEDVGRGVLRIGRVVLFLGVLLLGALLVAGMPAFTREAAATVRREPLQSAGLGLAMVIGVPVAAVLMMVTIIGIPVGLVAICGYVVLLMLGYLTAALFIGDTVLERMDASRLQSVGWRILFLLLALVALALLRRLPVVGGLLAALLFLAGTGAFTLRSWRGLRGGSAAA